MASAPKGAAGSDAAQTPRRTLHAKPGVAALARKPLKGRARRAMPRNTRRTGR